MIKPYQLVSETVTTMIEGVTTRLQKEMSQLQKDMANIESKLDGVTNQMRAEIKLELETGMLNVQKELEKMFAGLMSKVTTGKSVSVLTEPGFPAATQPSFTTTMAAGSASKENSIPMSTISQAFDELGKLNPWRGKLDCPKFDGYDYLGWRLKVEQYFEAVNMAEEDKV